MRHGAHCNTLQHITTSSCLEYSNGQRVTSGELNTASAFWNTASDFWFTAYSSYFLQYSECFLAYRIQQIAGAFLDRKGVMLNGPFFTTQQTTLIEYLITVLDRRVPLIPVPFPFR